MGRLWAAWQAAVTAHQLPRHPTAHTEERQERKKATNDWSPSLSLTGKELEVLHHCFLVTHVIFHPYPLARGCCTLFCHLFYLEARLLHMKGMEQISLPHQEGRGDFRYCEMGEGTQHIRSRNRGVIYFCSTAWNYVSSCRDEVVKDLGGLAEKEGGRKEYLFLCTETLLCTRTVNDWCGSSVQGEQYICPLGSSQQQTCSWLCCSSYSHAGRGGHLHIQRPNCNWVIVGAVWGFSGLGTGF